MRLSPFIKNINESGGTFYTFTSAAEDLMLNINKSNIKFKFSKFALLDLPKYSFDVDKYTNVGDSVKLKNNYFRFNPKMNYYNNLSFNSSYSPNQMLVLSLQNYCMNLETTIRDNENYNYNTNKSHSEKVFWKWLKELGVLRFRNANMGEKNNNLDLNCLFVEEDENNSGNASIDFEDVNSYSKVVRYIGDIDVVNSLRNNDNSFGEVYVRLGVEEGSTPVVLFKTDIDDVNYKPGEYITNNYGEYINGRKESDINRHPLYQNPIFSNFNRNELLLAQYDVDSDGQEGIYADLQDVPLNSYVLERNFYDYIDNTTTGVVNTDYPIYDVNNLNTVNSKVVLPNIDPLFANQQLEYLRTNIDGLTLDFNTEHYNNVQNFSTFNKSVNSSDFKFNVVLVYYDMYEVGKENEKQTNLYGVLFLNKFEEIGTNVFKMPTFLKFKQNPLTQDNGNSWGFKLNFKLDPNSETVNHVYSVGESNTHSMELYIEALNSMKIASEYLSNVSSQYSFLKDEIYELKTRLMEKYDRGDDIDMLNKKVLEIEKSLIAANYYINDKNFFNNELIEINKKISGLYNNETDVKVSYDIDLLQPDNGISITQFNEKIKIKNTQQNYNVNEPYNITIQDTNLEKLRVIEFPLIEYSNYKRINILLSNGETPNMFDFTNFNINNTPFSLQNIYILIDDRNVKWVTGQVCKIKFSCPIIITEPNSYIHIHTLVDPTYNSNPLLVNLDFDNSVPSLTKYYKKIYKFNKKEISINQLNMNYPINYFEIICVDSYNLLFEIDIY